MRGPGRGLCAFTALAAFVLGGCGPGHAAEALALAEPYVDRFDRFDSWARRTLAAGPAIRGSERLEETLFAPLGLEGDVVDAWALREHTEPGNWSLRGGSLPEPSADWVRVRHPVHGDLGILLMRVPRRAGSEPEPCVILARSGPGPKGSRVEVLVAFILGPAYAAR